MFDSRIGLMKIFSSPGVSSKPLNWFDVLKWTYREFRYGGLVWPGWKTLRARYRHWRWTQSDEVKASIQQLKDALSVGSYSPAPSLTPGEPLKIESLDATMKVITFP